MKIVIVVPSSEYKSYAGARIRYGRILPLLPDCGAQIELADISDFDPAEAKGDVFIFSKCHDSRSLVAAAILADRGRPVGVDLFDDYFSQAGDSRLARFRNWLAQMLDICSFAMCSTEAMRAVIDQFYPDLPVHVMNDPAFDLQLDRLPAILEAKSAHAREHMQLIVGWFGVGDNPHFPVGINDLAAFGEMLRELGSTGMDVQLRVLTNARSLTAARLAQLRRLPVDAKVSEWTEERERELLAEALVAFLPVNLQSFSTAKSLNRAVTALSAGCQVLSAGYPLYRQFEKLIYRDPKALLSDLTKGKLKLSPARIEQYHEAMESFASPAAEAERLAGFLQGVTSAKAAEGTLVLLHGHGTNGAAHKLVQAAGGLSVASPYCSAKLGFDVIFQGRPGGLRLLVSQKASRRLPAKLLKKAAAGPTVHGKAFLELPNDRRSPVAGEEDWSKEPLPFQLATYAHSMAKIRERMIATFGPCKLIVSESSQLPFSAVA